MPSKTGIGIILTLIFIIVIATTYYTKTSVSLKEPFVNKYDPLALANIYKDNAIERCEALYADVGSKGEMRAIMTDKAVDTMDNYILGHRIREWIPKSVEQQQQLDKNKKYCYMFFDSNNGAIDPLLNDPTSTCSMINPLFQSLPFVDKVFADSAHDITHTLPYTKCVMEIKPTEITADTMDQFWSRMGESQCQSYQNHQRRHITGLSKLVTDCNNEFKTFESLDQRYKKCTNQNNTLQATLNQIQEQYTLSNCGFYGNCSNMPVGSLSNMTLNSRNLTTAVRQSTRQLTQLSNNIAKTTRQVRAGEKRVTEMNISYTGINNDYIRCTNTDLPTAQNELSETRAETGRLTDTCNILVKQYNICLKRQAEKRGDLERLIEDTNNTQAHYDDSNNRLITCLSTNDYLRNSVTSLKDQTQKVATQSNECSSAVVARTAERNALVTDTQALKRERDEWLRRCQYDQSQMLRNSITTINQLRQTATQHTRQNCGNDMAESVAVNDLIKRKFEAIRAAQQPLACSETQRVQCCAARGLE